MRSLREWRDRREDVRIARSVARRAAEDTGERFTIDEIAEELGIDMDDAQAGAEGWCRTFDVAPSGAALRVRQATASTLVIQTATGEAVARINLDTGDIWLAEHMTADDAAREFWDAVLGLMPRPD